MTSGNKRICKNCRAVNAQFSPQCHNCGGIWPQNTIITTDSASPPKPKKKNDLMAEVHMEMLEEYDMKLSIAIGALRTGVGHEPLPGLEPRPFSEALAKIEALNDNRTV